MATAAFKRLIAILVLVVAVVAGAVFFFQIHQYPIDDNASMAGIQIEKIGASLEQYRADTGAFPTALEVLTAPAPPKALGPYLRLRELRDPWEQAFHYRSGQDGQSYVLFTLGSDGRPGGRGQAEDIAAYFPGEAPAP